MDNYPETLDLLIFLNPPWAFHMVWKMFQPLLSDRTQTKIKVWSGDYSQELSKHVDVSTMKCLAEQAVHSGQGAIEPGKGSLTVKAGQHIEIPIHVVKGLYLVTLKVA